MASHSVAVIFSRQIFPIYDCLCGSADLLRLHHLRYSINDGWRPQVQHISRRICLCSPQFVHGHHSTFHLFASHYALLELRLTITAAKKAKINILWQFFQSFYSFVKTIFTFAFWWFILFCGFAVACVAQIYFLCFVLRGNAFELVRNSTKCSITLIFVNY